MRALILTALICAGFFTLIVAGAIYVQRVSNAVKRDLEKADRWKP